jgi:hypothetical protein
VDVRCQGATGKGREAAKSTLVTQRGHLLREASPADSPILLAMPTQTAPIFAPAVPRKDRETGSCAPSLRTIANGTAWSSIGGTRDVTSYRSLPPLTLVSYHRLCGYRRL